MSPRKNPFSKSTKALIITLCIAFVVATVLLCVGGMLAGWNIVANLTSKTALLVYAIVFLIAVFVGYYLYTHRR